MRFVNSIIRLGLYLQIGHLCSFHYDFSNAYAQTADVAAAKSQPSKHNYTDLTLPAKAPSPRFQKGQSVDKLRTIDGLKIKRFARRLGDIQSIMRGANGQLYTTDARTGRIFIIPDSNQDGRPEQIRALPYRFNNPSAAIELGDYIYIADSQAIWKLPKARTSFQEPQRLASLENIKSLGPCFLAAGAARSGKAADLILGYSSQNGKARLLSINVDTGHATLIQEGAGRLEQLTSLDGSQPWLVYRNPDGLHIGTSFEGSTALGQALYIHGIVLPHSDKLPKNWPKALENHVLISRGNPINVTAMPSSLGSVLPRGFEIFAGFQSNRTAWGQAGALHIDKRGLFIADPYNGDIWRVYAPLKDKDKAQDKAESKANHDKVRLALENFESAKIDAETPLKRDPLKGAYESHFPISSAPKAPENTP